MMERVRRDTLWAHFVVILLGVWLISSPFALGFRSEWAMTLSDVGSGVLAMLFGALSLSKRFGWAPWANVFVGLWLLFAPLVFLDCKSGRVRQRHPGRHADDFTGSAGAPHAGHELGRHGDSAPTFPPGWDYSPSDWTQRLPIIVLAFVGFFLSRYMAAYQLGHIPAAWDPFFGDGTETIITSEVSKAWPVPDAGLGALSYCSKHCRESWVTSGVGARCRGWSRCSASWSCRSAASASSSSSFNRSGSAPGAPCA